MDWKEIEWTEPPDRLPQSLADGDLEQKLLQALFGDQAQEEAILDYLAGNWARLGQARSMPVAIENGVLVVKCLSAPARQNLLLKFPSIQREVQSRFQLQLQRLRFEQKAPVLPQKIKEPKAEATDTVKGESPLIRDIRRILDL